MKKQFLCLLSVISISTLHPSAAIERKLSAQKDRYQDIMRRGKELRRLHASFIDELDSLESLIEALEDTQFVPSVQRNLNSETSYSYQEDFQAISLEEQVHMQEHLLKRQKQEISKAKLQVAVLRRRTAALRIRAQEIGY